MEKSLFKVSKKEDIFLFNGEKKTAWMVLAIYLVSTTFVLFAMSFVYFQIEKEKFKEQIKEELILDAKDVTTSLEELHSSMFGEIFYPRFKGFESAIFDSDGELIFTTFQEKIDLKNQLYRKDGFTYFVYHQEPYYLGAATIVIKKDTNTFLEALDKKIIFLPLVILFIIIVTSFFLVKIILKLLKSNIEALDQFIKDTTHELNTPIATIQSNLELLENASLDEKVAKKLDRIRSATIGIKNLYEDLVFLTLNKSLKSTLQMVSINQMIKNRIEYFSLLFKSKSLEVVVDEKGKMDLFIDESKITRLIDNLLSNSIKYSNKNKKITLIVKERSFSVIDEGLGMSQEEVELVFERYSRFHTKEEMGFGIGYNIIYQVIKEYGLKIEIDSKKGVGTCVTVSY